MITYSFIIPHHNLPQLLDRCLSSIPKREDIEIIVIDDNSDADKKPQINRSDVRLVFIDAERTNGAGRARNYGLKVARGKWIVFADCDDFFVKDFIKVLDKYKDKDLEVVYYNAKAVTSTLQPMPQLLQRHNSYFDKYDGSKESEILIRYRIQASWWKMVKRDFIERFEIRFEEVPKGNDVFFTYQVGYFAQKIAVETAKLYVYIYNPDGITNGKKSKQIYLSQICGRLKTNEFYKFIGHAEWGKKNFPYLVKILKESGFIILLQTLIGYCLNYRKIQSIKKDYVKILTSKSSN